MKAIYDIVGMKHIGTEAVVKAMKVGEPLRLVREPTNAFDYNAVQVHAQGQRIGYVKGTQAKALARTMDADGKERVGRFVSTGWPQAEVEE